MATGNFWIENRCIVVLDDDYEAGNHPEIGDTHDSSDRNCHRCYLEDYRDHFKFWDVVISAGYYEHGSIDYVENDKWCDFYGFCDGVVGCYTHNHTRLTDLVNDLHKETGGVLSKAQIYALFKGRDVKTEELWSWVERKWDGFYEAARRAEEVRVNAALDELIINWGYEEIRKVGGFSNGEAIYEKVKK